MANQSKNKKPVEEVDENDVKVYSCHHCSRTFNSSQALAGHCKRKVLVGHCKSHPSTKDEIPHYHHYNQHQREVPEAPAPTTPGQHFFYDPNSRYHHYNQPVTSQSSYTSVRKLACVPSQAAITFYEPFTHLTRVTAIPSPNPNPSSMNGVFYRQPIAKPNPNCNHNSYYNQPIPSQSSNNVRNLADAPSQPITFYEPFTHPTRVTTNPNPNPSSINGVYIRQPITCPMNRVYDRQLITSQSSNDVRKLAYAPSQAAITFYGPFTHSTRVNTNPNPNLSSMSRAYDHAPSSNGEKNNKEELDLTLRLGR